MSTPPEARERASGRGTETPLHHAETAVQRVAACLDGSALGERVIPHALAVAGALGTPLTLLRVLEGPTGGALPDPVEWDIRRGEGREYVRRLAREQKGAEVAVESEVVEGRAAEEICLWTRRHGVGLTVLCTHGARGETEWSLASTARKLVEGAPGSVLLVPASAPAQTGVARYRRVLVPVDGSPRGERVLPLAKRLAAAQGAEVILAHVVPEPELTEVGPLDAEAIDLREQLASRNERVANEYLDRLRAQLADDRVSVRTLVLRGGDTRSRLARLVSDEEVDLVVLSAHGRSARSDVPLGSVAAYLAAHVEVPLLIVRRGTAEAQRVERAHREEARLPSQATP